MKNISFLINTLSSAGGTQRVLTTLANLLLENYNVTIVTFDDKEPFFELKPGIKIKTIFIKKTFKPLSVFDFNKQIFKVLISNSCDYFISLDSNSVILQTLFLPKKTKLIIWEHFSISKNFNKILFKISRFYATIRAHKFVLLSKQEVRDWKNLYNISEKKLSLIYNPITIDEQVNFLDVNLYENKKIIAIGNNIHIKGFDFLIKAWSLLDKTDWKLEIVGLPEKEQKTLNNLIREYEFKNEIVVNGRISDIKEKYLKSSIYCLCSRKEATPLVLIESQYIGLPAIIFDNCEGALELLDDSGLVVEFGNINKYANALDKLITSNELYCELSKKARLNAQRFNSQKFHEKWCEILH